MKLNYLNKNIYYIPSIILQSKPNILKIIINKDIYIIRKELEIVLKSIENKSLIKLDVYDYNDYIYNFHIIKNEDINSFYKIHKIPNYLHNYQSKYIKSISFLKNI